MVKYLFGSRFSLAVHGHIEFADLIKNRWYNLAGTVHHIEQNVTDAIPDDDWTCIWGHQFHTKKKNPPFSSSFNLVSINWNTVHKIIIRLNYKKIPPKRVLEAIHVVYKNVWYPPPQYPNQNNICTCIMSHLVLEYIIHQNPYYMEYGWSNPSHLRAMHVWIIPVCCTYTNIPVNIK